jgi:formamidopyrimidine-DNA glycosylase
MIELPEAITIARQIEAGLKGKQIKYGVRNSSPHKFAFTGKHTDEALAKIVIEKTIGSASARGNVILVDLDPGYVLSLGCGGERILYHQGEKTLPKKHQLLFRFHDSTYLSVTISGWGEVRLLESTEVPDHPHIKKNAVSPISEAFSFECFNSLCEALPENSRASAKYFVVSEPGVWGVGNGCLQDILYRAKIHPKRKMISLSDEQRRTLFEAIIGTLTKMVELGGRDSERDLYNQPGGYQRILHSRVVGQPCRECGTSIDKIQYLGGVVYFCPTCQVE